MFDLENACSKNETRRNDECFPFLAISIELTELCARSHQSIQHDRAPSSKGGRGLVWFGCLACLLGLAFEKGRKMPWQRCLWSNAELPDDFIDEHFQERVEAVRIQQQAQLQGKPLQAYWLDATLQACSVLQIGSYFVLLFAHDHWLGPEAVCTSAGAGADACTHSNTKPSLIAAVGWTQLTLQLLAYLKVARNPLRERLQLVLCYLVVFLLLPLISQLTVRSRE